MIIPVYKGQFRGFGYSTRHSTGIDLISEDIYKIAPNETALFGTGTYLEGEINNEDRKLDFSVRGRSSLSVKGILCHTGTIDIDYRDEIKVVLTNLSDKPYLVFRGDRIAQLICNIYGSFISVPVVNVERTGGFGSTGV